ncbi:hypothetical protein, partial [Vibrio mexicanus]|uniref:hypothetical protein n=1 Tax=Vibrio mexicanus TaxID=1004326 RepID=UPI000A455435
AFEFRGIKMDKYTFIVEMTKALAWPATIAGGLILLRKPLLALVPFMRKLKYKELEMEFSEQVQALKSEANITEKEEVDTPAMSILSFSTRAAVLEAWMELESASASKAASFWSTSNTTPFKNNFQLGSYLHQCGVLNEQQLKSFNELRQLRNQLVHSDVTNLKESDAKAYITVASNLVNQISSI